jgi:hypothetical protein
MLEYQACRYDQAKDYSVHFVLLWSAPFSSKLVPDLFICVIFFTWLIFKDITWLTFECLAKCRKG